MQDELFKQLRKSALITPEAERIALNNPISWPNQGSVVGQMEIPANRSVLMLNEYEILFEVNAIAIMEGLSNGDDGSSSSSHYRGAYWHSKINSIETHAAISEHIMTGRVDNRKRRASRER